MRVFITVLVLIFSLQSWTKAEDISEFEIEGISVGDSLLDYFNKSEIEAGIMNHQYNDDTFYDIEIYNHKLFNNYQNMQFSVKKNDKNYKIYLIVGFNFYKKNVDKCLNKVDEVSKEVADLLQDTKKKSTYTSHAADSSGKSKNKQVLFQHETGTISVECYDWSDEITKEKGWTDNFGVGISLLEFDIWLQEKAYN